MFRILERKRPLGRSERSWEDTFQTGLEKLRCDDLDSSIWLKDMDRWWTVVIIVIERVVPWCAGVVLII